MSLEVIGFIFKVDSKSKDCFSAVMIFTILN